MLNLSSCCAGFLSSICSDWYQEEAPESIASTSSRITAGAREVNESFYELDRPSGNASMQLLFFHGLQFQNFTNVHLSTWESRDGKCMWPQEWLVEEFPGSHVLYVSYDGRVGNSFRNSVFDIYNIAENFISDLLQADIGQVPGCPVILVGHSVGGIVIKQVFCQAHELLGMTEGPNKEKLQTFLNNLNGIFFYGTPHHGSSIADEAVDLCGGPLRNYFKILSKEAARLNHKFDRVCGMYPKLQIEGVGESIPTRLGHLSEVFIVPEASSRRDNFNIVDGDHFTICKPMTKTKRNFYKLETFLSRIVGDVKTQGMSVLPDYFQFVPDSVIGIDGPKEEIIEKLVNSPKLGLVGMGGVGKTTLAKAIFNSMGQQFEYTCFVLNVKLIKGDEQTVKQQVWNHMCHHGRKLSSEQNWSKLREKKLLLGLDDISTDRDAMILSELGQLTSSESRFIMTSRDQNLVRHWGDIYEVPYLNDDAAMVLFQSFAFPGQGVPAPELGGIMKTIVRKCDGLPLTLEVLGKYLKAKSNRDVWKQTLLALNAAMDVKDMNERLWAKLRPSYEDLGPTEQQMFLDATTFFSTSWFTLGEALATFRAAYKTTIERLLWGTLVDMSLVYEVEDDEPIKVHEQLQSLGRKIACEPSYSRKWRVWDGVKGVEMLQTPSLLNGKELYALRLEDKSANDDEFSINIPSNALPRLKNLHFLEVDFSVRLDGALEDGSFPTELVLLKCVGQNLFDPSLQSHLAYLELKGLEHLPSSIGQLSSLQHLAIASSPKLSSLPESFGGLSSLNHLRFQNCENLRTLPESFGGLPSLNHLEFKTCENLRTLPESFGGLSSLNHLDFYYCPKLSSLPESFGALSSLNHLEFEICENLRTLPESFGRLSSLNHLVFWNCENLHTLPESFGGLSSLNHLEFYSCPKFSTLPESFGGLSSLNHLLFRECTTLHSLPESFGGLSSLNHLEFEICKNLGTLPESFGGLSSLNHLDFYYCPKLSSLPESFGGLSSLKHLEFKECTTLHSLPESFGGLSSLNHLEFELCENLGTLPESIGGLSSLNQLVLNFCGKLRTLPDTFGQLAALEELEMDCALDTLPESFGQLKKLQFLKICVAEDMTPNSLGDLKDLRHLEIRLYSVASITDGIKSLPSLQRLKLDFRRNLVNSLPPWLMTPSASSTIGRGSRIWYTVEDGCFSVERELYQ